MISTVKIHNYFSIYDKNTSYFVLKNKELSDDVIAGMIIAAFAINQNISFKIDQSYLIDLLDINSALKNYIVVSTNKPSGDYHPKANHYGWWIYINTINYYLMQFKDEAFVNAFIYLCNQFGIDFRDLIYGIPFKYIDGKKKNYIIDGYEIEIPNSNELIPETFIIEEYIENVED